MSVFTTFIAEGEFAIVAADGSREMCRYRGGYIAHPKFTRCALDIDSATFGRCSFENADLFWTLIDFRKVVEPVSWRVLCNGARRDAWPSGMLGSICAGTGVYLLSGRNDSDGLLPVLDTFGPALSAEVATVEEQIRWRDEFFANWRPKV
jgi:hypothetical protein